MKNEEIVSIQKMRLVFPNRVHRPNSLRDVFVKALTNPGDILLRKPQFLEVIRRVDLTISRGDRVALMGVNGAGKTSLCRAIAGFYRPTAGQISVKGEVRAIFDTMIGIYPELTGRENAHILASLLFPKLKNREAQLQDALDFSELGSFLDTPFKYYSNGMQVRLCLSVLTMEPTDLLILDEVFEGADQFFREKIALRTLGMIEKSGAVIFVSHNEEQLLRVCNRAIILRNGEVYFDGDLREGLELYRTAERKQN